MIRLAGHVHSSFRHDADLYGRFIAACGGENEICIVPEGECCPDVATFRAQYSQALFGSRGPETHLALPFVDHVPVLKLGLRDALRTLAFLFDDRSRIVDLRRQHASLDEASTLRQFSIDAMTWRTHVAAWEEGVFLAPDQGSYAYFQVEERGTIQLLARSESLAAVAWKLQADAS